MSVMATAQALQVSEDYLARCTNFRNCAPTPEAEEFADALLEEANRLQRVAYRDYLLAKLEELDA